MATWKILVVEDDPFQAMLLLDALSQLRAEILQAGNGMEALHVARQGGPDLILLDAVLPDMDGFQVARGLKGDPTTRDIPLIFLTARDRIDDKLKGLEIGADDYITKPFHFEELLARVRRVLQRAGRRRAAPPPPAEPLLKGRLEAMSLTNLIQMLDLDRKSGELVLTRGEERGQIYFEEGQITHALQGGRRGEAAIYRLLTWTGGEFELVAPRNPAPEDARVQQSNQTLLMEGARRMDEAEVLKSRVADVTARFRIAPVFLKALDRRQVPPEVRRFVQLFDGNRTLAQVIEQSGLDDLAGLELAQRLDAAGLFEKGAEQKRDAARASADLPIRYQSLKAFLQTNWCNISGTGMFLRTGRPLPVGEVMVLTFQLPDSPRVIKVIGKVVWSSEIAQEGTPAGMGIRFLDLDDPSRDAIEAFVQDHVLSRLFPEQPPA